VDVKLKYRIVGIMVLFALAVIFVPMVLDGSGQNELTRIEMEIPPAPKLTFSDEHDKLELSPAPEYTAAKKSPKPSSSGSSMLTDDLDIANNIVPQITSRNQQAELIGWVVQIGAFSEKDKAIVLKDTLADAGFDSFIEVSQKQGKQYYRVKVGPELTKDKALLLHTALREKLSIEGGFVVSHPSSATN
jgi:DedD protein